MKNYNFPIIIEKDEDGYFVSCPNFQGCYTQGDTYEEAVKNARDIIKLHIADRIKAKEKLPQEKLISLSTVGVSI
jgi:predicted RNase H-like HicB family nuclease